MVFNNNNNVVVVVVVIPIITKTFLQTLVTAIH